MTDVPVTLEAQDWLAVDKVITARVKTLASRTAPSRAAYFEGEALDRAATAIDVALQAAAAAAAHQT